MARTPTRSEPPHASLRTALTALDGRGLGEDEVELGYVSGIFGVRGEVRLFLHNHESDTLDRPRRVVLIDGQDRRWQATLSSRSGAGKRILGRLVGLDSREGAATLQDWVIAIPRDELPELAPGEFYLHEIEGMPVVIEGEEVGHVVQVHQTEGGVDVLEVDVAGESRFAPCLLELGFEFDREHGVVRLGAGALDDA